VTYDILGVGKKGREEMTISKRILTFFPAIVALLIMTLSAGMIEANWSESLTYTPSIEYREAGEK
jgi:hypothetical protein